MDNTYFKKIAFLLSLLLAITVFFVSCSDGGEGELTDNPQSSENATEGIGSEAETEPPAPEFYDIVSGGVCSYKIVYPADMPADSAAVKAAMNIRKSLERFTTSLPISATIGSGRARAITAKPSRSSLVTRHIPRPPRSRPILPTAITSSVRSATRS